MLNSPFEHSHLERDVQPYLLNLLSFLPLSSAALWHLYHMQMPVFSSNFEKPKYQHVSSKVLAGECFYINTLFPLQTSVMVILIQYSHDPSEKYISPDSFSIFWLGFSTLYWYSIFLPL